MTAGAHPSEGGDGRTGSTRRAVDELIGRSGARAVAAVEDLDRFKTALWDSDEELKAFLDVQASCSADA